MGESPDPPTTSTAGLPTSGESEDAETFGRAGGTVGRPSHSNADRWTEATRGFIGFPYQQAQQCAQLAATLTLLELPGALALPDRVAAAATIASRLIFICSSKTSANRARAVDLYRRDGRENHSPAGCLCHTVTQASSAPPPTPAP